MSANKKSKPQDSLDFRFQSEPLAGDSREKRILRYWLNLLTQLSWSEIGKSKPVEIDAEDPSPTHEYAVRYFINTKAAGDDGQELPLNTTLAIMRFTLDPITAERSADREPIQVNPGIIVSAGRSRDKAIEPFIDPAAIAAFFEDHPKLPTNDASFKSYLKDFERDVLHRHSAVKPVLPIGSDTVNLGASFGLNRRLCNALTSSLKNMPPLLGTALRPYARTPIPLEPAVRAPLAKQLLSTMDSYDEVSDGRSTFALDRTQRLATLAGMGLDDKTGEMVAVNGPPGTGKTTFLRAVISTRWTQAILSGKDTPDLVVGCGFTNQSVTNIVDSFNGVARPCADDLLPTLIDQRWIAGLPSYGVYMPSSGRKQSDFPDSPVLQRFKSDAERDGFQAFKIGKLATAVLLPQGKTDRERLESARESQAQLRLRWLESYEAVFSERVSFLSALEHLRRLIWTLSEGISRYADGSSVNEPAPVIPGWNHDYSSVDDLRKKMDIAYASLTEAKDDAPFEAVNDYLDVVYRTPLFHLTARYWEGRFLNQPPALDRVGQARCARMLFCCFVSTIHNITALAEDDKFVPQASAIDLALIDEASQAIPHLTQAALSVSRCALIVGDRKQLAPIAEIEPNADRALRRRYNIDRESDTAYSASAGAALDMAQRQSLYGIPNAKASAGEIPLSAGITLLHHYRCQKTIIDFSSWQSYGGALICDTRPKTTLWPPMTWVNCKATPERTDFAVGKNGYGSSFNNGEAREVAEYLLEHWDEIRALAKWDSKPEDAVLILTPYSAQVRAIQNQIEIATKSFPISVATLNALKTRVKTVHSIQGGEAPIVFFSLVNPSPGGFIDDPMLNVAVSRAQLGFTIFGDRSTLFANALNEEIQDSALTPVEKLGRYLERHGERLYPRAIAVVESDAKVPTFQAALGKAVQVFATSGQVRALDLAAADGNIDWTKPPYRLLKPNIFERIEHAVGELGRDLSTVYIATDDDLEGEGIGWHVLDALRDAGHPLPVRRVRRMRVHSIDVDSIRIAQKDAGLGLDMPRVRAALTRAIANVFIGARFARPLGARGYGRVKQPLLLAIAAEREEQERRLGISVDMRFGEAIEVGYVVDSPSTIAKPVHFKTMSEATGPVEGLAAMIGREVITNVRFIQRDCGPPPSTDTLGIYHAAAKRLAFSPAHTAEILESLYLGVPTEHRKERAP